MVMAFWAELSQLVGGARMNKQNQMSHIQKAHKLVTGRKGVGKENTCKQLPLCMIVGRCQLCHGVHLHTSSGQSACKCKRYLLFAEEVPC